MHINTPGFTSRIEKLGTVILRSRQEDGSILTVEADIEPFSEELSVGRRHVVCPANSWHPDLLFGTPAIQFNTAKQFELSLSRYGVRSPGGKWVYANTLFAEAMQPFHVQDFEDNGYSLRREQGAVYFTEPVIVPVLYGPHEHEPGKVIPWMSYIPSELVQQRNQLRHAKGKVVIGGYGMGWFTDRVLNRPEVTSVTVVEACTELMDWYGHDRVEKKRKDLARVCRDVKVGVVLSDLFDYMEEQSVRDDVTYLLDIWPYFQDAMFDGRLIRQLIRGHRIHAWGLPGMIAANPRKWLNYLRKAPHDPTGRARLDHDHAVKEF